MLCQTYDPRTEQPLPSIFQTFKAQKPTAPTARGLDGWISLHRHRVAVQHRQCGHPTDIDLDLHHVRRRGRPDLGKLQCDVDDLLGLATDDPMGFTASESFEHFDVVLLGGPAVLGIRLFWELFPTQKTTGVGLDLCK